jgi:MFS family permease
VNGVLQPAGRDLGASPAALQWVVGAYALAFGGFLLAGGRAADLLGPRRTFAVASAGFALASLACAAAPAVGPLFGARAVQGLAAAFLEPAAFALLAHLFPAGRERVRALAIWGSVGSLGAVSGMLVGGATAELVDWRAVFLLNVPVGLAGLVLARRLLPAGERRGDVHVDVPGAVALTAGCSGLALLVGTLGSGVGPLTLAGASLALAGLAVFLRRQRHTAAPLVPRGFVGRAGLVVPAATGAVQGAVMLGSLVLLAVTLVEVMGLGPVQAGIAMLGMRATQAGWARGVPRLVERLGPRRAQLVGLAGMAAGCASLARIGDAPSYLGDVLPGLVVLGLSAPFVFVSGSTLALQCVRPRESGLASGLLGACQWLGGGLGLAAVSALVAAADGIAAGVRAGFALCAALAATAVAGAMIATWGRPAACRLPAAA